MSNSKTVYNDFVRANLPEYIRYDSVRNQYVTANGKRFVTYNEAKWYTDYIIKNGSIIDRAIGNNIPQVIAEFDTDTFTSANKNLGPELVTNGTFDTDSDWLFSFDWGISGGQASSNGTTSSNIYQTGVTETGKLYQVSVDVLQNDGSCTLRTNTAATVIGDVITTTGTFTFVFVAVGDRIDFRSGFNTADVIIDNFSVREVVSYSPASTTAENLLTHTRAGTATYTDSTGTLQTAASGELRKDNHIWDGSSWVKRCLVEPQSTNLLLNSDTLATQNVTVTAALHTLHFTGTGTVTLSGASTAGPLVGTGTGEQNRVSLQFTPTAGTLTLTVTGTVSNAQLETGVQTSYIPTAGAQVTRPADALSIDSTLLPYDSTAMTIAMEGEMTYADTNTALPNVAISGALTFFAYNLDNDNYIASNLHTGSTRTGSVHFRQENGSVLDEVLEFNAYSPGTNVPFNIASRHTSSDINGAVDGTALTANTTPTALPDLSATDFQIAPTGVINIKSLRILGGYGATDAELGAATT